MRCVTFGFFCLGISGAAHAAERLDLSGYVDAQYRWQNGGTNTFLVNEGAIYLDAGFDGAKAEIDLPFTYAAGDASNAFTLGQQKAQAWVSNEFDEGWMWKFGQFHSFYGSEDKDSAGIPFTQHGMLTRNEFPWTHTGVLVGYLFSETWKLELMVANPADEGVMSGGNPDFGLKLGGGVEGTAIEEISVAALSGRVGPSKTWMFSGILGVGAGRFHFRGDILMRKISDIAQTETAGGGTAIFDFTGELSGGARVEASDASTVEKFECTAGPQYKASKTFTAKLDYTFRVAADGAFTKSHIVGMAGVYRF